MRLAGTILGALLWQVLRGAALAAGALAVARAVGV